MLANGPEARQLRCTEKPLDQITGRVGLVRPTRLTSHGTYRARKDYKAYTGTVGLIRTTRPITQDTKILYIGKGFL